MSLNESVLCIPTAHMLAVGEVRAFRPADQAFRDALLDPRQFSFRPRSEVETDPSYLQLIPYVVLRCGPMLFHYRRGASGTEARLRALRSVGIGGHISTADAAGGDDPYRTGMMREVTEEVDLRTKYDEQFLGFIHDNRTPVGSVHLGVVHVFELAEANALPREDALAEAGFAPLTELKNQRDEFETWSAFVLEMLK